MGETRQAIEAAFRARVPGLRCCVSGDVVDHASQVGALVVLASRIRADSGFTSTGVVTADSLPLVRSRLNRADRRLTDSPAEFVLSVEGHLEPVVPLLPINPSTGIRTRGYVEYLAGLRTQPIRCCVTGWIIEPDQISFIVAVVRHKTFAGVRLEQLAVSVEGAALWAQGDRMSVVEARAADPQFHFTIGGIRPGVSPPVEPCDPCCPSSLNTAVVVPC